MNRVGEIILGLVFVCAFAPAKATDFWEDLRQFPSLVSDMVVMATAKNVSCTSQETETAARAKAAAIDRAAEMEENLLSYLINAQSHEIPELSLNDSEYGRAKSALKVIQCIRKVFDRLPLICVNEDTAPWYTFGHVHALAFTANHDLLGRYVFLTDRFFTDIDERRQMGIIVHEASHKCGADDIKYYNSPFTPYSLSKNGISYSYVRNADTYLNWAHHGITVPKMNGVNVTVEHPYGH